MSEDAAKYNESPASERSCRDPSGAVSFVRRPKVTCPECNGTGQVGDFGPGGLDRPGRRTGNSESVTCGCRFTSVNTKVEHASRPL